ncbi:MAG: RIP metalloprotease RseP [Rhodospirillales bacterium]
MDILTVADSLSFVWEIGIPFLVALTILVFVHELGHYTVARWAGVRVEVFSIGFGTELKGWNDTKGTRWKFCAIPLGGYVKMFGESEVIAEDNEDGEATERPMTDAERAVSFHHKTLMQRSAIVLAGPLVNFLFAILLFAGLFTIAGVPQLDASQPLQAIVGSVSSGSPADIAKLRRGDKILKMGAVDIASFGDLQNVVRKSPGVRMAARIERDGQIITVFVIPNRREVRQDDGTVVIQGLLGITAEPGKVLYVRTNPLTAIGLGFERTYAMTVRILEYLRDIIAGSQSADDLGGIIRIAQISGQVAELGLASYITFLAVLSVNLGLINLFPIPLLDGGHLAFYVIEAIRGKPLGMKAQEYGFRLGLIFVIALFLFVTWNDLVHLKFFEFISSLFT